MKNDFLAYCDDLHCVDVDTDAYVNDTFNNF